MIEKVFNLTSSKEKLIERVIMDENIHYMHMILNKDESLPVHYTNSTVYMTVVKGTLYIGLGDQEIKDYKEGSILKIPNQIKMNANNYGDNVLELIVIKAPAPNAN